MSTFEPPDLMVVVLVIGMATRHSQVLQICIFRYLPLLRNVSSFFYLQLNMGYLKVIGHAGADGGLSIGPVLMWLYVVCDYVYIYFCCSNM